MSTAGQAHRSGSSSHASTRTSSGDAPPCSLLAAGREAAFLDLDFQTTDRPSLVTQLLSLITTRPPESPAPANVETSPLWHLSVATRLKRLLHIVRDTEAIAALGLRLRCPHRDCGQFLEIELAFADLDPLHDEAADRELLRFPGADSRPLAFRRPTGDDLRRWRSFDSTTSSDLQALVQSLLILEPAAPEPLELPSAETCAAAFAEFDSLVAFQVATACPHCQRECTLPVDLETLALNRLQVVQGHLYQENHRLALAYGWSEADILQVPRARRQRYLAQVEGPA